MTRENAEAKGRRLLVEGRVVVEAVDPRQIVASVRGDSAAIYTVRYLPGGWSCDCDATGRCSHLTAVMLVTAVTRRTA